LSQKSRFIKDL